MRMMDGVVAKHTHALLLSAQTRESSESGFIFLYTDDV